MTAMTDAIRVILVLLILGCAFPPILPIMLVLSLAILFEVKSLLALVLVLSAAGYLYSRWKR